MSEIFYSEVDRNLQAELNARARTGKSRNTADIDFMVGKIGNVTVIPYTDPNRSKRIDDAILGGRTTRDFDFLPQGFLNVDFLDKNQKPGSNKLYRTPPYITSAEIAIGDHSMGLLNTATVNFTIPNPKHIEFIEAIYFRPGRFAEVIIEHPESACVNTTRLSPTTLESYDKIAKLYPNLKQLDYDEKYRKINKITFEGLITSFTFDYQPDFSITATISLRGTSNVYTDVSLIVDQTQPQTEKAEKPKDSEIKIDAEIDTFFTNLKSLIESQIPRLDPPPAYCKAVPRKESINLTSIVEPETIQSKYLNVVVGTPSKTMRTEQRYITLAFLVQYINDYCLKKLRDSKTNTLPSAYIIFNEDVCKSTFYDPAYFKSANPERIFFTDVENRTYNHSNNVKNLVWFGKGVDSNESDIKNLPPFKTVDGYYTPASIMINLNVIDEIVKQLKQAKSFTVGEFLKLVSNEVYEQSGHAIELTLTTHPEDNRFLVWYDSKFITKPGPQIYYIPMTSDDTYGQVVRDFKFSGKLPDDASHLAYALNQDLSSMSESDIAPYVSYLYAQGTNEYADENIKNALRKYALSGALSKINDTYTKSHLDAIKKLKETIQTYATDATANNSLALRDAMQKYIQFPLPTIEQSNNVAAPVIPFDTEFTVDGINGFKYGDVISFRVLPTRYVTNTVFSVINVTHTIGSDGVWTTTVRSIMRPKFD